MRTFWKQLPSVCSLVLLNIAEILQRVKIVNYNQGPLFQAIYQIIASVSILLAYINPLIAPNLNWSASHLLISKQQLFFKFTLSESLLRIDSIFSGM